MSIRVGAQVVFNEKVFSAPFAPYYDAYKKQIFKVLEIEHVDLVRLRCISDPSITVAGLVHLNDLQSYIDMG